MVTVCAHRDAFSDLKMIVGKCTNIVDGGSFHGGTVEAFANTFPNADIYCFEPVTTKNLEKNFSKNSKVHIFSCALGETDTRVTMRVGTREETSSINPITAEGVQIYGDRVNTQRMITVPMRPLDSFLTCAEIIKLDVHGFELAALRGGTKVLNTTKAILIEVCFVPLFEGQPMFAEINTFLQHKNFYPYNFYNLSSTPIGRLVCADVLYLRK